MKTLLISCAALAIAGGLSWWIIDPSPLRSDRPTAPQTNPAEVANVAAPPSDVVPSSDQASTPQAEEAAPMPLSFSSTVGQFRTVDPIHPTAGTIRLVTENGQRYLDFDETFTTARGPDVRVVLYPQATVPGTLGDDNYLTLAPLQQFTGAQRYAIPDTVNLADYQSVGIWCRRFDVTFGYATL